MDFSKRCTDIEQMDDPTLDPSVMVAVYEDIDKANLYSGGHKNTVKAVQRLLRENHGTEFTIVDMGSGNGTMLRQIVLWGRKNGYRLKGIGLDLNPNAVQLARATSLDFPEIRFEQKDILSLAPGDFPCDLLLCSLTMHHFKDDEIPVFLEQFARLAKIGVIINDLQRSRIAYYLFKGFSAIFTVTPIAKNDGLISIKSGFTKKELLALSKNVAHASHSIAWKWAFRYIWIMRPNGIT